jgi:DHA1 family tetracycline resistance protein-like MFS transporter
LPRKRDLNPLSALQRVFTNPQVRRLCAAFFLFFLAFNGFTAVLVLYFKQAFNWGPGLATTAFLVVGVVATVVQGGLIGPLVARVGEWRLTLVGLGFVIVGALVSRRLDGDGQGAALGSLQGLQSLGSFLGPPLAGLAYDLLGQRSPFWLGIAVLSGVVVLVAGGLQGDSQNTKSAPI